MTTRHLVDEDLLPMLEAFPDLDLQPEALPIVREALNAQEMLGEPDAAGVIRTEVECEGLDGGPSVRALLYRPVDKSARVPAAFLHLHGGGMVVGRPEMSDIKNIELAANLGITILSADYRLAPEHPMPAPVEDCTAALAWLHQNAGDLGIDPGRIAVGGDSAGGGLAAATVQLAVSEGKYPVCFQHLVYPMLDDRSTADGQDPGPMFGEFVWTPERNRLGWGCYIGDATPAAPHVPGRATDLAGQPPAWIAVGALDLFLTEDVAYAHRLMAAGVRTELQVYPGAPHGFPVYPPAKVSQRFHRDYQESLARGLGIA